MQDNLYSEEKQEDSRNKQVHYTPRITYTGETDNHENKRRQGWYDEITVRSRGPRPKHKKKKKYKENPKASPMLPEDQRCSPPFFFPNMNDDTEKPRLKTQVEAKASEEGV